MDNLLLNEMMRRASQNGMQRGYPRGQTPPPPPPILFDPPNRLQFPQNPYEIGGGIMRLPNGVMVPARQALQSGTFGGELVAQMMRSQGNVAGPSGSMPTPVGMNRPTFSSWLNQQRAGDGRSTVQQRIGEMRNRAGGGQISGDATGMGYNFVGGGPARQIPGDATGMGNNAMSRGVMRNTFQDRAEQMRNGGGYR